MKESCSNCRFAGRSDAGGYYESVCRRFPPIYTGDKNYPAFPRIPQDSYLNPAWCGEWQLKVEEPHYRYE